MGYKAILVANGKVWYNCYLYIYKLKFYLTLLNPNFKYRYWVFTISIFLWFPLYIEAEFLQIRNHFCYITEKKSEVDILISTLVVREHYRKYHQWNGNRNWFQYNMLQPLVLPTILQSRLLWNWISK